MEPAVISRATAPPTAEFTDVLKVDVIALTTVERIALQNAIGLGSVLLTADSIVAEAAAGGGDDYDHGIEDMSDLYALEATGLTSPLGITDERRN